MQALPHILLFLVFLSSGLACIPTATPDDMYEQEMEGMYPTTSILMTMVNQEMTSTSGISTTISTSTVSGSSTTSLSSTTTPSSLMCPNSLWILNPDTARCYMANVAGNNWQDAKDDCISLGGNLVSIADATENAYVYNSVILPSGPTPMTLWWIGLKQTVGTSELSGMTTWEDGTPYDFNTFNNWNNQPPTPGDAACVRMRVLFGNNSDSKWDSGSTCNVRRPYICETGATSIG